MQEVIVKTLSEFVAHIESIQNIEYFWFRGVAKNKYLPVPGLVWKDLRSEEGSLEHNFLVSYKSYINEQSLNSWELFALMQHHGLPTRLLDWSESALVALFFALTSEPNYRGYRAVWVMDPYELNKSTIGVEKLYCPAILEANHIEHDESQLDFRSFLPPNLRPLNVPKLPEKPIAINSTQNIKRVSSQKGCFTIHGSKDEPVNEYLKNDKYFHLIKLDVRTEKLRKKMLNSLAALGIDEEFIYQDLDSLVRNIKRIKQIS
ncbi:FRG domain-containing protein [Colwelliaceae bacterium 6471]